MSRLKLSVEAIKMLISKLRPNDSIGIVTFTHEGQVLLNPVFKSQLDNSIFGVLDGISAGGGTTIRSGFILAKSLLLDFVNHN